MSSYDYPPPYIAPEVRYTERSVYLAAREEQCPHGMRGEGHRAKPGSHAAIPGTSLVQTYCEKCRLWVPVPVSSLEVIENLEPWGVPV